MVFDVCHIAKLIGNLLKDKKIICHNINVQLQGIKWHCIESLNEGQKEDKMNVSLAAQTLSASVVSPTDFLRDELSLPQFQDSDATAEFISCIDLAFDLMYSRNPFAKGTNQSVILEYFPKWASECESLASYIFHLKDEKGCFLQSRNEKLLFGVSQ